MSSRRYPPAASVLRGLVGSAFLCLARTMSLRGAPVTCLSGPSGGAGGGGGGAGGGGGGIFGGGTSSSSSPRLSLPWLRLPEVPGAEPFKANDVLLLLPPSGPLLEPPQHHVVYFPGDVQNYREIMVCHPENFQWEQWCLENIAAILGRHFPESYIWVIKCSRMHLHKFSCYDNFVASNMFGAPEHSTDFGAFRHLHALLVNAFKLAQNILLSQKSMSEFSKDAETVACQSPTVATTNGCPTIERERVCKYLNSSTMNFVEPSVIGEVSFTLIGFSKGCVVLNQLLHELKEAKNDKDTDAFIKNIKAIYWLDGGHSGGSNTWVTYPDVLKDFSETGISVNAHVTPYQVFDTMRAWIGKEHKRFVQILEELGVNVNNQLHFADEAPSLDNHFRVHEVF
ncbi:mitochondrial protein C2orf69 homolog isoform X1 [Rhineura floridana]|uniref:mitochondrial protein C2orf69 homolog isoform X1 n=1 Tax=Rhineura floridana TaxID=261503 RepID=UPI002AC812B6|nr:mitochondrial protein C2orf69 homolog isoform X1 [Rhineura floridana]